MTCGGCSGAVSRALAKVEGMRDGCDVVKRELTMCAGITYDVSLEKQEVKVKVTGDVSYDEVLGKIKKTGKEVVSGKVVQA
ncbi:copper chaperone taha [Boletus reticuloceps]|uniref:Copper chaperone taha n=1 Tax=Boletus reticuloceps TaxID=495285 RepID=A0A8I2YDP3_9AGAM|nr:copper chaperone taha [Boletus reticuloceps]